MRVRDFERFQELCELLNSIHRIVDVTLVEGMRDVEALRSLGFRGDIIACSQIGGPEIDLVDEIASKHQNVLILTDFDSEGRKIYKRLTRFFETKGVMVETGIRRRFGRLMAANGLYAIESLDDLLEACEKEWGYRPDKKKGLKKGLF